MSVAHVARTRVRAGLDEGGTERVRSPRRSGLPVVSSAHHIAEIQRLAGNGAVAGLLSIQRCGSVAPDDCGCHPAAEVIGEPDLVNGTERAVEPVQRTADPVGRAFVVQRHSGFRTKAALQTEVLNTPALQNGGVGGVPRAGSGSEFWGDPVRRLQEALTAAGFRVAPTSTFDAATNRPTAPFSPRTAFRSPPGGRPARKPCRRWTITCSERLHQRHHRPTAHNTNRVSGRRR